ncbi:MAG: serine/threonine-protein kinase [Pseudomonadota bacterium]
MISTEHWPRYSALLDEALELDTPARAAWLADLQQRDAETASTLARLLDREAAQSNTTADSLGERAGFGAALHAALVEAPGRDAALAGQSFGPWQVSRKLGVGGMGEVWLAERADALYEGKAAIKLLRASGDTTRLTARFSRERQALARLAHPGIARLLDAGIAASQPYLVLEYVRGRPLLEHAQDLSLLQRVQLVLAIGRAVEYAHGRLIVHRDLKPSNVMVTAEGEVKLLDFGIASLIDEEHSEQTSLTGLYGRGLTLDYAAPEQIAGEHTGVGADVFSLGVMLFELLTGERPFKPAKVGRAALEHAVLHQPTPRPSSRARGIPSDLDAVVVKALHKSPEDRYPTMAGLNADLERWLEHRPVLAAQRDRWRDTALWLRRNRLVAALSGAVMLSLLAGLLATQLQSQRLIREGEKTAAVQGFLTSLLAAPNPWVQTSAEPTLRSVIDTGAARVDQEFATRPDIQLPLLLALSETYINLGQYDAATGTVEKALALGALPDLTRARLLHFKGRALFEKGQHQESEVLQREALRLQDQQLGPGSAESVETLMYLAFALSLQGQSPLAVGISREALAISDRSRGPTHALSNLARYNHALMLLRSGDLDEAIVETQKALATAVVLYSRDVGQVGCIQQRLGNLLLVKGRYGEAEPVLRQAVGNLRATMPGQPYFAFALQSQARLLLETDRAAEALPVMQEALATFTAAAGESASNTISTRLQLAEVMAVLGERKPALDMARAAAAALAEKSANLHATGAIGLGVVLLRGGQVQDALVQFDAGLALRRRTQREGHFGIAIAASWLALGHAAAGDAEAQPQLAAAADLLARTLDPAHFMRQRVAAAQRALADRPRAGR